ncbi:tail fiber domain-containing protein [Paracoccus sp. MA]|uniref:tail fiber domain-containing protein n=1 Tax=Paracoccus sp. MA TaxID=2895796 RepID=UPI001E419FCA|nr:tail fiber domain-containing protein [Paracoccus sp. MA]UFM64247.1 tail fiber domain-containing protein [Paracoccus sp. MA]
MGGGSAPDPDPNIGLAALKSAETGEAMLGWMRDQADITNEWAAADRERWETVFRPLQDSYIREAQTWDSAARKNEAAQQAVADVRQQAANAEGARVRQAMAMGINPNSGRFNAGAREASLNEGLAAAGAQNVARRRIEQEAEAKQANAINMGSGLAVNPATSMGLSNGAIQAGGAGAMHGFGQQGQLLNTQYNQQLQSWQANQNSMSSLMGGLGTVAGMMLSSKDAKTDKTPLPDGVALGAIRKMPVEKWRYKEGMGDGQAHIGPYAEDFAAATGQGDGKTIDVISALGVTMGAIRDLDKKVDHLSRERKAA